MSPKVLDIEELEDLRDEGKSIVVDYDLELRLVTRDDIDLLWKEYYMGGDDEEITHMAVAEARSRATYDLRVLNWLWEWYGYWSEERDLSKVQPSTYDYVLFFTIRGPNVFNTKNTSFYECVNYLRKLEQGRDRRRRGK